MRVEWRRTGIDADLDDPVGRGTGRGKVEGRRYRNEFDKDGRSYGRGTESWVTEEDTGWSRESRSVCLRR